MPPKTILDTATRNGLIARINALSVNSKAQWGKMNVGQMVQHCILWEEMAFGRILFKQKFIGFIFGKMVLKRFTRNDNPLDKGTPTSPEMVIKGATPADLEAEKQKWISLIQGYEWFNNVNFIHPFFGKMTPEQIGIIAYKHTDHHLRQFGG